MAASADARRGLAVVTGASSGIGAASARALADAGFDVLLGARRADRLAAVAADIGPAARSRPLDVTDAASVQAFAAGVASCEVVVCNAGGALGLAPVAAADEAEAEEERWRWMWEANVAGVARTVRAFLPALVASGDGRIVVVTSVAGHQVYPGGGGYTAAKHAAAAVVQTLRLELLGQPVRIIEIAPGMVDTEFSLVRFDGDAGRAAAVYTGTVPLTADDVADAVTWAVTRPPHVTIARLDLFPRDQASARDVHRRP
ncbi:MULTISPECIES: SDR family NAD(P)-dependent oxidoreductase [unclassified Frankia]|uniref:SDR family NAD(P)-dependent oxidoreductase n=1 Tax=unclassified Frankia TaxID=2632575 RepID=UPI0020253F43